MWGAKDKARQDSAAQFQKPWGQRPDTKVTGARWMQRQLCAAVGGLVFAKN